ncbi:enoyl-CoA hydratase-related protein [Nocardia alni]|uniref:enoyl-CoA hydratase-related protein n=1 Tax=Nocardia alni TaxID=2815723 RepID=UPI001C246238|nr:enoyl-CoA hydratase-related protein [Nocardia alni]
MSDELIVERHGAVLTARINRPEARNALNGQVIRGIGGALLEAEQNVEIRALLITGTGDRAFCAGMDLKAFADGGDLGGDTPEAAAYHRLGQGKTGIPVVGAANATAVGGGLELLMSCDVIVASSAAKFGLPEVKRGLYPGGGGTFLGTRIPMHVALEIAMTGDPITAERAYQLGLVNVVAEPDEVASAALSMAERIAANAPLSLAAIKELVRVGVTDAAAATERTPHWHQTVFGSQDAKEGARAFVEKRTPVWQGR